MNTIKNKLRLALFFIGFSPYFFILIYIYNLGEKKIIEDIISTYKSQTMLIKKAISQQIFSIQKDTNFLASLNIMNDILVNDIDKRISQLLLQKKIDSKNEIDFLVLNNKANIVASTLKNEGKTFIFKHHLESNKNFFFKNNKIFIYSKINSTMSSKQTIGYLISIYPLKSLKQYAPRQKDKSVIFYFEQNQTIIGDKKLFLKIEDNLQKDFYIGEKNLYINESFNILTQGKIIYQVSKKQAFSFFNQFILFISLLTIGGFIVIGFFSWWVGEKILKPINELSKTTKKIIKTQNYSQQVKISTEGEIKELSNNFNTLLQEVNKNIINLKKQNQIILERYIQLINLFNTLIKTTTKGECIDVAMKELKNFMPNREFSFSKNYPFANEKKLYLLLFVSDFEHNISNFYGTIAVKDKNYNFEAQEKSFFRAIATMIMLQLDQIELIKETKEISSAKSSFISLISHELKTPLHTILSSAQYLISFEELNHKQQKQVATIESSAYHLLTMINDILELVKIEAKKVKVNLQRKSSYDIEKLIQEIIDMMEIFAQDKGLYIKYQNNTNKDIKTNIDISLLRQIFINILSNAIKFTNCGGVKIILKHTDNFLEVSFIDSGIGIHTKDIKSLFEDFKQLKTISDIKGSGLGLAISKRLAKLFDAEITIHSLGLEQGTTVTIQIPTL